MPFFMAVVALDLRDIFLFFLNDVGVSTYYRRVIATTLFLTLFLSSTIPRTTSLVVQVFFASITLVGRRLLGMLARYINGKDVNRLILSEVFFLFFCRLVLLEILDINFLGA